MKELKVQLQGELSYNKYNNPYSEGMKNKLFAEFNSKRGNINSNWVLVVAGYTSLELINPSIKIW